MRKRFIVGLAVALASLAGAPLLEAASPAPDAKAPVSATAVAVKKSPRKKTTKARKTKRTKKTSNAAHVKKGAAAAQGGSKS
jgi:hypothetical protein